MPNAATGKDHTVTISDDGSLYSFGSNMYGQLGLSLLETNVPNCIPNLQRIKKVSCGYFFTVCVDDEGFAWSFGDNSCGQLGIGSKSNSNHPQKMTDIPPVRSVSCGSHHTLILTKDETLWSCGYNEYGQLCIGNRINQSKPICTSYTNITRISSGSKHNLFQNNKGDIYSCGNNTQGQLGLGHNESPQSTGMLIYNQPPNIIQFCCGSEHCLFLDVEGNVFGVGDNAWGQLALNIYNIQYVDKLIQLQNIPPIQIISCAFNTSFLVDFDGNLWGFGSNGTAQIRKNGEHNYSIPQEIEIKDIKQLSYGCCAHHFLVKDSQNAIFVMGSNKLGQLGVTKMNSYPREMDSHYFPIWGNSPHGFCKAKSARK